MQTDYDLAKTKYQSVVSRKVEAELAQELELKSAKSTFNVISPAGVPVSPSKPDRPLALLISLIVALGSSGLLGLLLEMRDESLRDVEEVKDRLPIPVLAVIPFIHGKNDKRTLLPAPRGVQVYSSSDVTN